MIISSSRRTDIPGLFSEWFMNRVAAGSFHASNPYSVSQVKEVSLLPRDVDAIVFWTKNPEPMLANLDRLDTMGYHYYFQFTLNDYPRFLEPGLPPLADRIRTFRALSDRVGPGRVVWRWDPIIISSATPPDYVIEHLESTAEALQGYSERLVISLLDFYGKVKGRLNTLAKERDVQFLDFALPEHRDGLLRLAGRIKGIADRYGLEVYTCAEAVDLSQAGILPGACIDGNLLKRLFGITKEFRKDRGQRPECLCAEAVDMGVYNTCSHQCAYCYANYSGDSIRRNLEWHHSDSPSLVDFGKGRIEPKTRPKPSHIQEPLIRE